MKVLCTAVKEWNENKINKKRARVSEKIKNERTKDNKKTL
jgi:hypothetical protein